MRKTTLTEDTNIDKYLENVVRQEYKKQLDNSKEVEKIEA